MLILVCPEGKLTRMTDLKDCIFFLFVCVDWPIISKNIDRYNLLKLVDHFHNRGLYRSIFLRYWVTSRCYWMHVRIISHKFFFLGIWWSEFINICDHSIMEGEKALEQFSPEIIIQNPSSVSAVCLLPHMVLFHGTTDYSIPCDARLVYLIKDDKN